jgi:toxin ParE1/3/4
MNIEWSPAAIADLRAVYDYIAEKNIAAAQKVVKRIKDSIQHLARFPLSGRPGRVPETRELAIYETPFLCV